MKKYGILEMIPENHCILACMDCWFFSLAPEIQGRRQDASHFSFSASRVKIDFLRFADNFKKNQENCLSHNP